MIFTKFKYFYVSLLLIISFDVKSYPNFIGFGYTSCMTCHYNPYGNGPLNDYGRALGATLISDRIFSKKNITENDLGDNSGFLYYKPPTNFFRPSLNYRGLLLKRNFREENEKTEYIHMQLNANTIFKFGKNDKYLFSLSVDYAPTPLNPQIDDDGHYRSREHYFGHRINETIGYYVGFMDKVFGIRIPDHPAFSRSINSLGQNDQTHGLLVHIKKDKWELGIHPFIGSLTQDRDLRQRGLSTKIEYEHNKTKSGLSFLKSKSEFNKNYIKAFHTKIALSKGSSVMAEFGELQKTNLRIKSSTKSRYAIMQNHIFVKRGLFFFQTLEFLQPNSKFTGNIWRFGPGIQYFPQQGIELRIDLYNTKSFSRNSVTKDKWDFTGQFHLWF